MNQPTSPQPNQTQSVNNPRHITLRDGKTVVIRSLPWTNYLSIKSRILDAISGEIGRMLMSVSDSLDSAATGAVTDWLLAAKKSGVLEKLPVLIQSLNFEIDHLIEDLVSGCCLLVTATGNQPLDFSTLHALDVLKLRKLLLESSEIAELFDAEKNCYLGVWTNVLSLVSTGTSQIPGTDAAGGADSNTSSTLPTDGATETWGS